MTFDASLKKKKAVDKSRIKCKSLFVLSISDLMTFNALSLTSQNVFKLNSNNRSAIKSTCGYPLWVTVVAMIDLQDQPQWHGTPHSYSRRLVSIAVHSAVIIGVFRNTKHVHINIIKLDVL